MPEENKEEKTMGKPTGFMEYAREDATAASPKAENPKL